MSKIKYLVAVRVVTAAAVLVAIGTQLSYGLSHVPFSVVNFFSYFTILSNFLAAIIFLASAVMAHTGKQDDRVDGVRGAATLYMVITGIVYVVLLSNVDVQTPIPWVNSVIHYLFPIVILLDWLLDPPTKRIQTRIALSWLAFPLLYAVYSLVRGPFAHDWYPYPFINVSQLGYVHVLVNCVVLAIVGAALAVGLAKAPFLLQKR